MANFDVDFPEEYMQGLLEADLDSICLDALKEAAPILEKSMKKEVKNVLIHDGESELVDSIKTWRPKKAKNGAYIVNVCPAGYSKKKVYRREKSSKKKGEQVDTSRTYPVSNALKLLWKEYGIEGHQAARPFLMKSVNNVREEVLDKIQKVFNQRIGGDGK